MKLGIRVKLFFVSFALIAVSVFVADAYLTRATERQVTESVREDLFVRAALVAREASSTHAGSADLARWDAVADALGRTASARVTLISRTGAVLGDSEVDVAQLPAIENHAARPEVGRALGGGRGHDSRVSATIGERLMYVAVPVPGDGPIAVARLARPLREVDEAVGEARRAILVASAIALALAILLASAAAQRMAGFVQDLTRVADRMTHGDLDARTRVRRGDELGELATALDQLAGSLSTTLDELKDERDLMARILEGMTEGVLVLDKDDRIVLVNGALRAMLLLGQDARGKLLLEAIRHAELEELLARARAASEVTQGELDLPGLQPRRLLVHAASLSAGAGHSAGREHGGLLAVFVDVTHLRRLETLRRDFVANVSHELRTPVTALLSATETLRGGAIRDPAMANKFLDILERNARRLQALIEDLLELSRLDAQKYNLRRERVDLAALFTIVAGLFRERVESKGVRLATSVDEHLPPLEADPRALEQVLVNLVDNAVKYCPSGASVTLTARDDRGQGVILEVQDTGPGIEAKHLPRLFERFYRVDTGRSRELGGTGLGLSIVKHLTEAMGGTVAVASTVGKGTTFTLRLGSEPVRERPSGTLRAGG